MNYNHSTVFDLVFDCFDKTNSFATLKLARLKPTKATIQYSEYDTERLVPSGT